MHGTSISGFNRGGLSVGGKEPTRAPYSLFEVVTPVLSEPVLPGIETVFMNETVYAAPNVNGDFNADVSRILDALHREVPIPPNEEFVGGWSSPPLDVLDCVLSIKRNYGRFCLPRVVKFRRAHPEITTLTSLLEMIESYPTPLDFSKVELNYSDERRAATLVGVLKALLHAQKAFSDSEETLRLTAWAHSVNPADYETFGAAGFGLSGFQYLRILFGAQTIKPDVHIRRFVSGAVGRNVSDVAALDLMEAAGKKLGWSASQLDSAVWNLGARTNGSTSPPP